VVSVGEGEAGEVLAGLARAAEHEEGSLSCHAANLVTD